MHQDVERSRPLEMRSKAYQCAIINLSSNIPLPSVFYQNNHRRIYYDDQLQKHTQFKNEYIYAFTWEDPRIDHRLLKIRDDDVVLCITSAGDNVLDYLYNANPRRIHAVDLNPNQNHLLELKIAAFQSLPHAQVWQMFGEGRFLGFREALITKLSPHISSQACQYWLNHGSTFSSRGLYETGGSRYADTTRSPGCAKQTHQTRNQARSLALHPARTGLRCEDSVQGEDPQGAAGDVA